MAKAHKPKNLPPGNAVARKKLSDLTQDAKNANKGTARGNAMIEKSLRDYGAGRSILLDKHGAIIAGNKTAQNAAAAGLDDVLVIKTDGRQLVAVQRIDLDLAEPKALQLALADNRAGEVSLDWDADVLKELAGEIDLAEWWSVGEIGELFKSPAANDPNADWIGMPGFENTDDCYRKVIVSFEDAAAVVAFFAAIGQPFTDATKSIWFPAKEDRKLKGITYKSE